MKTENFKATPISRAKIRELVKMIRKCCGLQHVEYIPVPLVFEHVMQIFFPDFQWEIKSPSEMMEEGLTLSADKTIYIRQDVYEKACHGDGRARFTIMHEIGHLFLHRPDRVALCRLPYGKSLKPFENPEWQADTFAAEFLMDADIVHGLNYKEISKRCGVTYGAAKTRVDILKKDFK